jgi:hypothetical protein
MTRGCGCDGSFSAWQAFGRRGIAQRRQQEVDGGARRIDGPVEITPTALHSNICLINAPGFVGRLEMTAQPLFQFGPVTLHPTPDGRVIRRQTALGEQLFDIAQRQRVPKIPAHGTKNQLRRRLPPLEDCRSGCVLHDRFRLPAIPAKLATHPFNLLAQRYERRSTTKPKLTTALPAATPPNDYRVAAPRRRITVN